MPSFALGPCADRDSNRIAGLWEYAGPNDVQSWSTYSDAILMRARFRALKGVPDVAVGETHGIEILIQLVCSV